MKKNVAVILAVAMMLACIPAVSVSGASYANTYTNTGDQRADIIGVALTQVGYREGANNDTKYGDWYGLPNHPWCAMFISWCANQAGIPTSVLKKAARANPTSFGIPCYSGTEYRPQAGDLFFNKSYSHAGIVYYTEGNYFYTLEGNTNDSGPEGVGVFIRKKPISDYYFGVPNYQGDVSHSYQLGYESAHPHRAYYKCSDCGDSYYTGETQYSDSCATCITENCQHSYGDWVRTDGATHTRTCSKCGTQDSTSHNWDGGTVTKNPTCNKTGTVVYSCKGCKTTKSDTLPVTDVHEFGNWTFKDESKHQSSCTVCGKTETEDHALAENWSTDDTDHWYSCDVCSGKVGFGSHEYGENCLDPCFACGYVRPDGHQYDLDWYSDETAHWHICTVCDEKKDISSHVPGPAATEDQPQVCTVCDFELVAALGHTHAYTTMEKDEDGHYLTCSCGKAQKKQGHTWDEETNLCAVCGQENPQAQKPEEEQADYSIFLWAGGGAILACNLVFAGFMIFKKKRY